MRQQELLGTVVPAGRTAYAACMGSVSDGETAAFVIHGEGIMSILESFAKPRGRFYDYHVENCACAACEYQDGRLLVRF